MEPAAVFEHGFRSPDVGEEGVDGLLDDQPYSDGRGQVVDDVALVDELADDGRREDRFDDQMEVGALFEVGNVRPRAASGER